ncbi:hypothetical protein GCG21_07135 [Pseudactinotalea sp. HY160]|uniref:YibE/F family protein n=1 Tax=Pseudactinotalea sp. HY160 TaxID=2654490 RepID=UPI00128D0C19|nr:hypothetical protein [Pseudactinotalea sp. HY160]
MTVDVTPAVPARPGIPGRALAALLLLPLVLATVAGLLALWPGAGALSERHDQVGEFDVGWQTQTLRATLTDDLDPYTGSVPIRLPDGEVVRADAGDLVAMEGLEAGTPVVVMSTMSESWTEGVGDPLVEAHYWIQDVDRSRQLRVLAVVAAAAVLACGLWRGARALLVVAAAGALGWFFLIPNLLSAEWPLWALACTVAAIVLAIAVAAYGVGRRAGVTAWALLAGAAVVAATGWFAVDYAHLSTGITSSSTAFYYYFGGTETPDGLYQPAAVLAGVAALSVIVPEQVRLASRARPGEQLGLLRLVRASAPSLQRALVLAGLLGGGFLVGPALARRLTGVPGGMQFTADLELGLVLVFTAIVGAALAAPVTAGVVLGLGRLVRPPADDADDADDDSADADADATVTAGPTVPADGLIPVAPVEDRRAAFQRVDSGDPQPAQPTRPTRPAPPQEPRTPAPRSVTPGELRPARREQPEAAYRRPPSHNHLDHLDQLDRSDAAHGPGPHSAE